MTDAERDSLTPAECLFYPYENEDGDVLFAVTERLYFRKHGHREGDHLLIQGLPAGFHQCMEGVFEFAGDQEVGRQALIASGFEEIVSPQ